LCSSRSRLQLSRTMKMHLRQCNCQHKPLSPHSRPKKTKPHPNLPWSRATNPELWMSNHLPSDH
jgi:hypothetical protein